MKIRVFLLRMIVAFALWQPISLWADDTEKIPDDFIYVRYGSNSVLWMIYQRSLKPKFGSPVLTVGAAPNPHNSYREGFGGFGFNLNKKQAGIMPTLLFAQTKDGPYLESWFSPWFDCQHWSFNSFIGTYLPLNNRGAKQFFIDPITLTYKTNSHFAVGSSYTMTKIAGTPVGQGIGPAFQITIPKGTIILDWFKGVSEFKNEYRATLQLSF